MSGIRQRASFLLIVSAIVTICSCLPQILLPTRYPVAFDPAIRSLANDLMSQVEYNREIINVGQGANVLIDPFFDADTNEVPVVSSNIEKIISDESYQNFNDLKLERMTSKNLREADYIMNGAIHLRPYRVGREKNPEKYYHISASVVNLKTGRVIGHSEVWVSNYALDTAATKIYQDSPIYPKDKSSDGAIAIAKSGFGAPAENSYYNSLETMAILTEAGTAYESGDYKHALDLFTKASQREDGQLMRTYAGLYSVYRKLGQAEKTDSAFLKLLSISVKKYKIITVKFLFNVNSVDFWKDEELTKQYESWLRIMGEYFYQSSFCLHIIGHCSKTGSGEYNNRLSMQRALRIQNLLEPSFPTIKQRSETIGKGYMENIKGLGTDDERDAVDRRVDFIILDCDILKLES